MRKLKYYITYGPASYSNTTIRIVNFTNWDIIQLPGIKSTATNFYCVSTHYALMGIYFLAKNQNNKP